MYWQEPTDSTPVEIAPLTRIAITVLGVLIIIFGIFPAPILTQLREPVRAPALHVAQR